MTSPCQCVVVLGPTATGKTRLGVALARSFGGEIISVDSRQVYRGLDLGTGKDLEEYGAGADRVPYHLIDVADPAEEYHLFRFVSAAAAALRDIADRGHLPVLVGGTALYLNAILERYTLEGGARDPAFRAELAALSDEELVAVLLREAPDVYARTDLSQRPRIVRALEIARSKDQAPPRPTLPALDPLLLGTFFPRATVHRRIEARLDARLRQGLIEEIHALHRNGLSWDRLERLGLEYRYVALYLQGALDRNSMRNTLLARIRRFARSQDVWFRKMEREGKRIHWIPAGAVEPARDLVAAFLRGAELPAPQFTLSNTLYGPRSA